MTPLAAYERRVAGGHLETDPVQRALVAELDRLHGELVAAGPAPSGFRRAVSRLLGTRRAPVEGVYIWGGVGRGKTLLMDLFYHCLPFDDKLRRHFHRFMADVHASLKTQVDRADPLELVADELAARARVICFDEFAVTDIADAMILGNLFRALFARGVTLAATSNIVPSELYREGLQRQQFLPAIELIERHTKVLHVDGGRDYRLRVLERADVYQFPADADAERHLAEYFAAMAPASADATAVDAAAEPGADDGIEENGALEVLGRPIAFKKCTDGIVWFDFAALCDGPRSQDDYIELSRLYQTVLVSNVPRFDTTRENEARRFIALVDEFYDRRVKLILSAAVSIRELYGGHRLATDFKRTESRLQEMQSHDYLAAAHRD